jgi:hypothetical protein
VRRWRRLDDSGLDLSGRMELSGLDGWLRLWSGRSPSWRSRAVAIAAPTNARGEQLTKDLHPSDGAQKARQDSV